MPLFLFVAFDSFRCHLFFQLSFNCFFPMFEYFFVSYFGLALLYTKGHKIPSQTRDFELPGSLQASRFLFLYKILLTSPDSHLCAK